MLNVNHCQTLIYYLQNANYLCWLQKEYFAKYLLGNMHHTSSEGEQCEFNATFNMCLYGDEQMIIN